ncbi:MAG: outer membrane beta-barrel protein [bacterium]
MKTNAIFFRFLRAFLTWLILFWLVVSGIKAYSQSDTLSPESKKKFKELLNNFDVSVYMDVYYNNILDNPSGDTSNIIEFASNCPFAKEFRLNVASVWLYYTSKNVRGKLELQWGDAPNLLAQSNAQFIKNMKQVDFGFRVYKTLWVDLGYLYNPIGYESSFPIRNQLSTVTTGGYFETGNFLGIKVSSQITPSIFAGAYVGNPYTLAYGKNKRLYAGVTFLYSYKNLFTINYNNMIGNAALSTSDRNHFYLYNNTVLTVTPVTNLLLVGEFDYVVETNASKPPDTSNNASGISGFLQVTYRFAKWFSASIRGEYLNDPDGLTGTLYAYDGKLRGLLTYGGTFGIEFNPVPYSYIRAEYSYLSADKGNYIFNSNLSDNRQLLTFTAGIRFGAFR